MISKVALGSISAGLALFVAVRSTNEVVQATAALVGSGCMGFTATTLVLQRRKERKNRETAAEIDDELLRQVRQMNHWRSLVDPPKPAACRGCCHYHGQVYGGNLLVCGMHPFGVDDQHCSDWQSEDPGRSEDDPRTP